MTYDDDDDIEYLKVVFALSAVLKPHGEVFFSCPARGVN